MHQIYEKEILSDEEVEEVLEILLKLDARNYCNSIANEYSERALADLEGVNLKSSMRSDLEQLAGFFLEREH